MNLIKPGYDLEQNQEISKGTDFNKIDKIDKIDPNQEAKLKKSFPFLFEEGSDKRLPPEEVQANLDEERASTKKVQEDQTSELMSKLNGRDSNINDTREKDLDDTKQIFSMILEQNGDKLSNQEKDKIKEFQGKFNSNLTPEDAKALVEEMDAFFVGLQESGRFDNDKFLKIDQDTRSISENLKDAGKGSSDKLKKAMPWLYDYGKEIKENDLDEIEQEESSNKMQESLSEQEQIESRKEGLKFAEEGLQTNTLGSYLGQLEDIKTFDKAYYNNLVNKITDRSSFKNTQKSSNFLDGFLGFHIIMLGQILRDRTISDSKKEGIKYAAKSLVDIAEESGFYDFNEDKGLLVKEQLKKISEGKGLEFEEMDTLAKNIGEGELRAVNNENSSRIRELAIKML